MFSRPNARVGGLSSIGSSIMLIALLWWWWPGLTGARPEVGIVVGGDVRAASEPLDRRLREEGVRTEWTDEPDDWCAVPRLLSDLPERIDVVVVSAPDTTCDGGSTADLVEALTGTDHRLVVVTATGIDALDPVDPLAVALGRAGVMMVDAGRLLAGVDEPVPCEWWDDCGETGTVVTTDVDGLTEPGTQRVARTIVAAVVGEDLG